MLGNITIGQYFPSNSVIHRLDARMKLVLMTLLIVFIFVTRSVPSLLLVGTLGEALCAAAWAFFRTEAFGAATGDAVRACEIYELVFRGPATFGAAVLALYALLVLAFSFSTRLRAWAWTAAGIVATHYAYGWNFLRGLFARSMPDGVQAFDHQG